MFFLDICYLKLVLFEILLVSLGVDLALLPGCSPILTSILFQEVSNFCLTV